MANKNFTVKNGLEVGGQEVISSSGAITSAALGGQVLGTSASPSFANITTAGYLRGPASFVIDPAAHGDDTGTVVIAGNLQVDGTQTTINSTTMTVDDLNLTLASGAANAAAANGAGITVDITGVTNPSIVYGSSNDDWNFNKNLNVTGNGAVSGNLDVVGQIGAYDNPGSSWGKMILRATDFEFKNAGGTIVGSIDTSSHFRIINDLQMDSTSPRIDYDNGVSSGSFRLFSTSRNAASHQFYPNGHAHFITTAGTFKIEGLGSTSNQIESGGSLKIRSVSGHVDLLDGTTEVLQTSTTGVTLPLNLVVGGNVGIGTDSPLGKLHVRDGSAQSGISHTYIYDGSAISVEATEPSIQLMAEDSGTHGGSLLWRYGNNTFAAIANPTTDAIDFTYGVTTANDFQVHSGTNMSSYLKIMSIGADGNVGIGTDTPTTLTEIRGTVPVLTLSSDESKTWSNGDDIAKISFFSRDGSGIGAHETGFILNKTENSGASLSGVLVFGVANYNTAAAEAMRIDHDGNVGIGTDDPSFTAVSGSTDQIGLEIQNADNDSSAHLKLTGRNNTGTPGQATSFEIAHRGDALKTSFIHGGTEVWEFDSSGHAHLGMNDSDTRLTFGNTGTANTNSSSNIRAVSAGFMYNSGGAGSTHIWEVNGAQRLNLNTVGRLEVKSADTSDNYNLVATSTNTRDPGLLLVRDSTVGFGIAVRAAADDYADFQVNNNGAPSYTEEGKMRIYHNGNISIPGTAAWSSGIGHVFTNSGAHYQIVTSTSTGNEKAIISNSVGAGGAVGILQYRNGGAVRGDYLVADHNNGIYFNSTSDYRFKENISTIEEDHLTKLTSLRPVTYTEKEGWQSDVDIETVHTGFIAHEIQEVYPEFVEGEKDAVWTQEELDARGNEIDPEESVGDPKYQTVAYTKKEWNVYMIRALQQLKAENEALKARLDALEGE